MDGQTIQLAAKWPKSPQLDALCTGNRMCKLLNFDCSFLTLFQWPEWLWNRWPFGRLQLAQIGQVHARAHQDVVDAHVRRQARHMGDHVGHIGGFEQSGAHRRRGRHRALVQQGRVDACRGDGCGADAVNALLHVDGLGQCQHGPLGG